MPDPSPSPDRVDIAGSAGPADSQRRDDWFTASPDPWNEIARLEFGQDRTFASNVQQMVMNAEPSQRPDMERRLLGALERPELTAAGRQFVCRMLGLIGSAASVPALAGLLGDDRSADDARLALDAIEDPSVIDVYRNALGTLRGRSRAGLIGSLAAKGDTQAVDALNAIAADDREPADVRAGAERAVEHLRALQRS